IGPLRADRRQPGRGRRAVPPAGRSAAGYRAGRGPDPGPGARADTRPPQRPVQPAHRRQPGRAPAPPDAAHPLEWSFALLTAPEQAMLTRLCVFAGRFTLDDVEPVCCSGDVAAADALDLLSSLIDKSLVIKEDADGTACYRLLETMREYARLRLREAGEEDAVERRCADHYLSRCAQFALEGRYRLLDWLAWAELEIDNVRAVLRRCLDHQDTRRGIDLATFLVYFWSTRATAEGVRWLDELLSGVGGISGQAPAGPYPWAYFTRGFLAVLQYDPAAARP